MSVDRSGGEPELVLTAPPEMEPSDFVRTPFRATLGAITQLVASAQSRVVMGSPFIEYEEVLRDGPIGQALAAALKRGVAVDLVSTAATLAGIVADRRLDQGTPGRLRLFQPSGNRTDERALGSHAKFCLADQLHGYVGSANFTEKGMTKHLEIGIIVHGAPARRLWEVVDALFRSGYFSQVL